MKIIPSINLKNGLCVRQVTQQYQSSDVIRKPVTQIVKQMELEKAELLHIVDIDGAMIGHTSNEDTIKQIIEQVHIPIEVGGGIRSIRAIDRILNLGASRVVIGTKAVQNPSFIRDAVSTFGSDKIVLAVDAINGMVVMEGWAKISSFNMVSFALKTREMGIETIIYTDVLSNGVNKGPKVENIREMVQKTGVDIIANGGLLQMKDLELVHSLGVKGAIVDSAIYEGKIDLEKAIALYK